MASYYLAERKPENLIATSFVLHPDKAPEKRLNGVAFMMGISRVRDEALVIEVYNEDGEEVIIHNTGVKFKEYARSVFPTFTIFRKELT